MSDDIYHLIFARIEAVSIQNGGADAHRSRFYSEK